MLWNIFLVDKACNLRFGVKRLIPESKKNRKKKKEGNIKKDKEIYWIFVEKGKKKKSTWWLNRLV